MKVFLEATIELLADAIRIFSAIILSAIILAIFVYILLTALGGTQ